jgi:hypothetical protein
MIIKYYLFANIIGIIKGVRSECPKLLGRACPETAPSFRGLTRLRRWAGKSIQRNINHMSPV